MNTKKQHDHIENVVARIAKKTLDLETLATRNSDDLDFHDLAVWKLKEALIEAYRAGQASKEKP